MDDQARTVTTRLKDRARHLDGIVRMVGTCLVPRRHEAAVGGPGHPRAHEPRGLPPPPGNPRGRGGGRLLSAGIRRSTASRGPGKFVTRVCPEACGGMLSSPTKAEVFTCSFSESS